MVESKPHTFTEIVKNLSKHLREFADSLDGVAGTAEEHANEGVDNKALKRRRTKKETDPNAPKRPLSSYMLYCQANRLNTAEKNPESKATEIATLLGKEWTALGEKDKQPYIKQYEAANKKYVKEVEKYEALKKSAPTATTASQEYPAKKPKVAAAVTSTGTTAPPPAVAAESKGSSEHKKSKKSKKPSEVSAVSSDSHKKKKSKK